MSYFAATLSLIIWENEVMLSVLESIFSQINKMFMAIVLFVIVEYWYVIWNFFSEYRGEYKLDDKTAHCHNLLDCFRFHIDYGFINPPSYLEDGPIPFPAELYNIFYVLFINLIITAIITGIIIDTFAEMR